ncbi:MAG: PadR family transcriptional regulator [Alphaproteobacteria bacterium]|nr:PadR family transcriptional regulator [Alphaproteobacteria bacterium]
MKQLSKLEYAILDLLRSGRERYGLEMVRDSGGVLKRGSIYVTLSRMQKKGYVASRQENEPKDPGLPLRLYKISGLGQRMLNASDAARAVMEGGAHA